MARPIRIEYEGAVYHVTIRVNFRTYLPPYAAVASASIKNSNL